MYSKISSQLTDMAKPGTKLVLFKKDWSPPCNAVRMLGDILGLQFEFNEPDLLTGQHKTPEYKKMNPMASIPVLMDGDFVVSESHAIMLYLLEKYGENHIERLYPSDLKIRAKINQCMYFDASMFFIGLKSVSVPTFSKILKSPTQQQLDDIDKSYSVVEAYLQDTKYIAADHLTLADLSAGSTATHMQPILKLDSEKYPKVQQWLDRLKEESFFKKIVVPGAAEFKVGLQIFWKKNNA